MERQEKAFSVSAQGHCIHHSCGPSLQPNVLGWLGTTMARYTTMWPSPCGYMKWGAIHPTTTFLVFSILFFSFPGKIPTPFTTSYSATKFALDGFFSSLRHELIMQKRNVSITLCILGLIDTDTALEKTRYVFGGGYESARECLQEHIPWKHAKKCKQLYLRWCGHLFGCAWKLTRRVHLLGYIIWVVCVHLCVEHEHAEPCGSHSA